MSEMLVDKHAAAVLEECDSFVEDRCILICFSSASFDVVNGAPVPVLDGVVLVPETWLFKAGEEVGDGAEEEELASSWLPSSAIIGNVNQESTH